MNYHQLITRAFTEGATSEDEAFAGMEREFVFTLRPAGKLRVPSGRIMVGDPLGGPQEALAVPVEPGEYEVVLSILRFTDTGEERVAFARVGAPITNDSELFRYAEQDEDSAIEVDSGAAGFFDETVVRLLDGEDEPTELQTRLLEATDTDSASTWFVADLPADNHANLIAFSAGFGDGDYPVSVVPDEVGETAKTILLDFVTE